MAFWLLCGDEKSSAVRYASTASTARPICMKQPPRLRSAELGSGFFSSIAALRYATPASRTFPTRMYALPSAVYALYGVA